ncbi:hypothetical protein Pcac1_g27210 [Phytophthora cactorum]|nr:hypothetical protein Pcac1_g27210 [Phytophthora cactorum]
MVSKLTYVNAVRTGNFVYTGTPLPESNHPRFPF